jgi:arylsulfatase A-like enzyme
MFRALLAGAALAALIDAALALPVQAIDGLRREYFMLSVFSTFLCALLVGVFLLLVARLPLFRFRLQRWQSGSTFWAGLILGFMPIFAHFFSGLSFSSSQHWLALVIWLLPCGLLLLLAPKAPKFLGPKSAAVSFLCVAAPVSILAAWLSPSSLSERARAAPDLPPRTAMAQPADGRPDLVLISIDTLRTDLQSGTVELLSVLTELQSKGVWHPFAYSTSNQTVPAHVGMLAGLAADKHFVGENADYSIIPGPELIANRLVKEAGYRTAGVISNAMVAGFSPGFEAFDNTRADYGPKLWFMRIPGRSCWLAVLAGGRRSQDWIAEWLHVRDSDLLPPAMSRYTVDSSLRYVKALAAGPEPYFLFSHFMDAHSPYSPPVETAGRLANPQDLPEAYRHLAENHRILINWIRRGLGIETEHAAAMQAAAHLRDLYNEEILFLDQQIRRLLQGIEDQGRPTLVILTSDHGEQFGEHRMMEHSNSLYQELIQVPFVLFGINGFEVPAKRLDYPPSLLDVVPTLSRAAGIPIQIQGGIRRPGLDLLDPASSERMAQRIHLARWNTARTGHQVAACRGDWKVFGLLEHQANEPEVEPTLKKLAAYRLSDDPHELNDRLGDPDPALTVLWQRLERAGSNLFDISYYDPNSRKAIVSAQGKAMLEALGYFEDQDEDSSKPKD